MKNTDRVLTINETSISEDCYGFVSLTDMWKAANKPSSKTPARWKQNPSAKALIKAFEKKVGKSYLKENSPKQSCIYSKKGRGSGTFAHPVIALGYAQALNPEIAIETNEIFLRYKSNDVELAFEILDQLTNQFEYDKLRVTLREKLSKHNTILNGAAKNANVTDFKAFNGAGLQGLYGGKNKKELLEHKRLNPDDHHLDHAGHEELAINYFKATQTVSKLKRDNVKEQETANQTHHNVGVAIRETIKDLGGTMPEDEPALENIKEAKKRIRNFQPTSITPKSTGISK